MLQILINSGNGEVDYTHYCIGSSISIERTLAAPSTCTLSLVNVDRAFQLPALRSYLRIFSTKYQRTLFSGFLINDANYNFLSLSPAGFPPAPTAGQLFQYDLNFTSDEYLLQLKAIPFIPAFVNQTQGQILQTLAETLCPGYFDYSNIASGQLVPYLLYSPTQSWSEYAKTFSDNSNYRYSVIDKKIIFQPYGDGALGIAYDETGPQALFDPFAMQQSSMTTPIVNDLTCVGSQEPGNNREDYFMGDGFTGSYLLRHQAFNVGGQGQNSGASGSVLLGDQWNETSFNTNVWDVQDPGSNFSLIDNALNIVSGLALQYGESYIEAANGIEFAGGIIMQHGEFTFNNSGIGLVGGVYDDTTLNPATCECAYYISPGTTVVVTASGASGINIQPYRRGSVMPQAFSISTQVNHTYVLSTIVSSPAPYRYTQIYTTMGGAIFGGEQLLPTVSGNITWQVQDTNIFTGFVTTYTFVASGQQIPSYAIYALINNIDLNLSVTSTQIYTPPMGTLNICSEIGASLLQPIYVSGNQQYIGAYTTPSGGNLPILPALIGPEQSWPLGSSLQNQTAEIDLGTTVSTLSFYSNDLPGVGTRIRLQTWESQASVSRVQDPISIQQEADVVGDDGIRSAIITNLNPLPRSSEDCDAAATAFITDRVGIFYQGTYTASYKFFTPTTGDSDFYPTTGRFLYTNAPSRNMNKINLLVTGITTNVIEMAEEAMTHAISFGPDLHLEKVLDNFVNQPVNILLPADTVVQPTPVALAQVGSNYLPDIVHSNFPTLSIKGPTVVLRLNDSIPLPGCFYELRSADYNWGSNDNYLLGRYTANQLVTLNRSSFEQLWYLRFVNISSSTGITSTSRRSKVLRLYWPQTPATPAFLYADSSTINCDFNGDIRNIEGIELRDSTDTFAYYDGIVGSEFDMMLNLDSLRGSVSAGASVIGGPVGSYMKGSIPIAGQNTAETVLPTVFTQTTVPGGEGAWQFLSSSISTDPSTYAIAHATGNLVFQTFAPMLCAGMTFAIPTGATLNSIIVNLDRGTGVGNVMLSSITCQLAVNGVGVGPVQTRIAHAWPTGAEFGSGTQSPDTNPDWNLVVTPAQLNSGSVGILISAYVGTNLSDGILLLNSLSVTIQYVATAQRNFNVHFFNLMWEYSGALAVTIPVPLAPVATLGYRWGASLQINVGSSTRPDFLYTTLQLATSSGSLLSGTLASGTFNNAGQQGIFYQAQTAGAVAAFQVNVPVTGDIYGRVQYTDHISAGPWSSIIHVPQGNLIASDYLGAQGSVPPTVTNGNLGSGGVIAYQSANNGVSGLYIGMATSSFSVVYPNGHIDTVPALYQNFFRTVDNGQAPLANSTMYGFFPSVNNPLSGFPTMFFNGPYLSYTGTLAALQEQFTDGIVPLTNGPFVTTTPAAGTGTTGGGGGGTGGGGNCAASERMIELHNGRKMALRVLTPGMMVKTPKGIGAKVLKIELFGDFTLRLKTKSGCEIRCGFGHVIKDSVNGKWRGVDDIYNSFIQHEQVSIWTAFADADPVISISNVNVIAEICRLHLDGDEHIYMVDGIWAHNIMVKNGS